MTAQNANLPKLTIKQSRFLINRLFEISVIIDIYKMLSDNADILKTTSADDFLSFSQSNMRLAIYIGFIAIISGHGLQKFLKSDLKLQPIKDQLDKIKEPFIYARDKYYAHMDFDFDYAEVPEIDIALVTNSLNQLSDALDAISINPTLMTPGRASNSVRHSLQTVIESVKNFPDE